MLPTLFSRPLNVTANRAFTLIELIVVIVVIGILATLATVSYSAVIERTDTEKVLATQRSVAREVTAILAFQDNTTPAEALEEALADLPSQATVGLSADSGWSLVAGDPTTASFTDLRTAVWTSDANELVWAVAAAEAKIVSCVVSLSGASSSCNATVGDVELTPVGSEPGPSVPVSAPSVPQNLVVTPGDSQLVVTWGPPADDGGDTNITFMVSVDPAHGQVESQTGTSALITGLDNNVSYTVTVVASNSAGVSPAATGSGAPVAAGLSFAQVSALSLHTCGVTTSGQAYCWGHNEYGKIGDGTTTSRSVPTPVNTTTGLTTSNVAQITAGHSHTCAVTTNGQAFCWGYNGNGQLGDGTTTQRLVPTPVNVTTGLTTSNVTQVSAGSTHTCAVTTNGQAFCWGYNLNGRLGDNTTTSRSVPTPVNTTTGFTTSNVTQISAASHTCAVTTNGQAFCWGANGNGQLGDGTTTQRLVPTPVNVTTGLTTSNVTQVSTGSHTCAVTTNGQAFCWGANGNGQLGDGTTTQRLVPTPVNVTTGLTTSNVTQISAGGNAHTCAVTTNGQAFCWGNNGNGKLGDNTTTDRSVPTPVNVTAGFTTSNVTQITTSSSHTCAVTASGQAFCWGYNGFGQLGDGTAVQRDVPAPVTDG